MSNLADKFWVSSLTSMFSNQYQIAIAYGSFFVISEVELHGKSFESELKTFNFN